MENRYTNTLAEVPASIVEIREVGVPMGFPQKQIKEGLEKLKARQAVVAGHSAAAPIRAKEHTL